jgi:hypothetical protein
MEEYAKMSDNVERCREMLIRVNLIYGEIDTIYDFLQHELSTLAAPTLMQKTAVLDELMEAAQAADSLLAEELRKNRELHPSLLPLLAVRRQRLDKLFENNRDLASRAENSQALLRHELSSLRQNRGALLGYKPPGGDGAGLIRTSF